MAGRYRYTWDGQALARLRTERSLTQVELAKRAGLYQAKLCRLEQGQPPTLMALAQLADALELDHGALFACCVRRDAGQRK